MNILKKTLSNFIALSLTVCGVFPVDCLSADSTYPDGYTPVMYFTCEGGSYTLSDGTVCIKKSEMTEDGYTLRISSYIEDDTNTCSAVRARMFSSDKDFITLTNPVDPNNPLVPFAYAQKDESGELTECKYDIYITEKPAIGMLMFNCRNFSLTSGAHIMEIYGETSDSYPLTSFDAVFSADTPGGAYEIFYGYNPDVNDQQTDITRIIDGDLHTGIPERESLNVRVVDDTDGKYALGDSTGDGYVDASDASYILSVYSEFSTGKEPVLLNEERYAMDINSDNMIDASDASSVLGYYAYLSTGGTVTMEEYMSDESAGENI